MKSYTDIEQSKVLAEILPHESADMYYFKHSLENYYCPIPSIGNCSLIYDNIPCWSLSALFETMPSEIDDSHFLTLEKEGNEYCCCYEDINGNSFKHEFGNNSIDACYEMIIKLHEKGLL